MRTALRCQRTGRHQRAAETLAGGQCLQFPPTRVQKAVARPRNKPAPAKCHGDIRRRQRRAAHGRLRDARHQTVFLRLQGGLRLVLGLRQAHPGARGRRRPGPVAPAAYFTLRVYCVGVDCGVHGRSARRSFRPHIALCVVMAYSSTVGVHGRSARLLAEPSIENLTMHI